MEDKPNNVIVFPKVSRPIPEQTPYVKTELEETLQNNIEDIKIEHINESLLVLLPKLFNNIDMSGGTLPYSEDDLLYEYKDINLIVESIKSLLYKRYELQHPFHKLADQLFNITEEGEISINKNIELEFEATKQE